MKMVLIIDFQISCDLIYKSYHYYVFQLPPGLANHIIFFIIACKEKTQLALWYI